jgi:hypothetical protein
MVVGSMWDSMIHAINDRINRFASISSRHANLRKHTFLQKLSQISQPPQSLKDTSDLDDCHTIRWTIISSIQSASNPNIIQPSGKKISYPSTFFDRTTSDKETSSSKRCQKV